MVVEAANGGFNSVLTSTSYTLPVNVEALYTVGSGLTGTGNSGANTLVTVGANTLTAATATIPSCSSPVAQTARALPTSTATR